ncbi:dpoa decarboxylase [Salmonella enterica]|nr:dpoa decarboxylase [Salmonella enterica]
MNKDNLFIQNVQSKHKDRITVAAVYEKLSKEAGHGCGLHYEIYLSRLTGLLLDYILQLNETDAEKLRRYAGGRGIKVDEETYSQALKAERECRAEIYREHM